MGRVGGELNNLQRKTKEKWISCLLVVVLLITLLPMKYMGTEKVEAQEPNTELPEQEEKGTIGSKGDEIVSLRSEKSKTYENTDGTFTTEISENPIHFKEEHEKDWAQIDNTLVPAASGEAFVNKANSLETHFSEQANENNQLVEIKDGDVSVALTAVGPEAEAPSTIQNNFNESVAETTENEIVYPELYPNVDVKYTVGTDRVKEDIILKEKPEEGTPTSFSFALDLTGLTYETQEDGRILFSHSETKESMFYLDKPFMYDSFQPEGYKENPGVTSFAEQSFSYEVEMKVVERENQLYVDLIPNREWLESEERVYPVVIDPTVVKFQTQAKVKDTNIRSHFPNDTGGSETTLGVGLYQDAKQTNKIRSLLNFDLTSIPTGTQVLDASLNLRLVSVWNDTDLRIDLHEVTNTWTEAGASWSKRDGTNPWTKGGGDYASSAIDTISNIGYLTDFGINYKWEIPSTKVQSWVNTPSKNKGLLLKANNETIKSWKKFVSSNDVANSKYSPVLAITYVSASRIGLESYWTFDQHDVAKGSVAVNVGTGNGVVQFSDFSVSGRGKSNMSFDRIYNTKSTEIDAFGPGWSFTGSENITEKDNMLFYTDRDGTTHDYVYDTTTKKFIGPPGVYVDIKEVSVTRTIVGIKRTEVAYEVVDKSGNVSQFIRSLPLGDEETAATIYKINHQIDRNGNKIQYAYNDKGDITGVTDASGRKMTIAQGSAGISSVEFEGKKYTYHYTGGNLREVREYIDATKYLSTFYGYDTNGKMDKITDPNGNVTTITYEGALVQSVQQPSPTGSGVAVTSYKYDLPKYTAEITDPKGGLTKLTLNTHYGVKSVTDPLGRTSSQDTMDSNFNPTQTTDAEGNIAKSLFDPKGNLLNATDAKGIQSTNTYDSFSSLKTATNSKGMTSMNYDAKGNMEDITEADGNITTQAYDIYGNRKSTTASDGTQKLYGYDTGSNNQTSGTDAMGRITEAKFDPFGNVISQLDAKQNLTSFAYGQRLLLEGVTDAKGGNSSYDDYDSNGNLLSIVNAEGKKTSFTYNGQNQLKSRTMPMGEVTTLGYDHNGNLTSTKKPSGTNLTNAFDSANQLQSIAANGVKKWGFTYDKNRNVKTITDSSTGNMKSFDYDANQNLDLETIGNLSVDYKYNDANELTSQTGKSNTTSFTQAYDFTETGKLKEIKRNDTNLVTFKYEPVGLPLSIAYSNGVQTGFNFDDAEQLLNLTVKRGTASILTEAFTHDDNGNIETVTSTNGNKVYTYDELNQLKSQTLADGAVETYEYDKVGNRLETETVKNGQTTRTVYGHNDNNELTSVDGVSFTYDSNGNRIKDGRFSYAYNKFDELQTVKTLSGQLVASYTYDEQSRRTSKTIGGVRTNYHYGQGIEVLFETNAAGVITAEYSFDQRGFPKTMTTNGQTYFYVLNGHYDVVALTNSAGQTVASYSYDAWGNILSQSGTMAAVNPYRYAGYRYDEETNHYYLIARYYNAAEGVFLAADPIAGESKNPLTQNGYSYANNNPVMNYDPNGNIPQILAGALVGAAIELISYFASLITTYGVNDFTNHIKKSEVFSAVLRGGASGALGFGVVGKLKSAGELSNAGAAFLGVHVAPGAYLISSYADLSGGGLAEAGVLSILNKKQSIFYESFQSLSNIIDSRF